MDLINVEYLIHNWLVPDPTFYCSVWRRSRTLGSVLTPKNKSFFRHLKKCGGPYSFPGSRIDWTSCDGMFCDVAFCDRAF